MLEWTIGLALLPMVLCGAMMLGGMLFAARGMNRMGRGAGMPGCPPGGQGPQGRPRSEAAGSPDAGEPASLGSSRLHPEE